MQKLQGDLTDRESASFLVAVRELLNKSVEMFNYFHLLLSLLVLFFLLILSPILLFIHFKTISDSKMLNGLVKMLGGSQQQIEKGPQLHTPEYYIMHKEKMFLNTNAIPSINAVFCIISTRASISSFLTCFSKFLLTTPQACSGILKKCWGNLESLTF